MRENPFMDFKGKCCSLNGKNEPKNVPLFKTFSVSSPKKQEFGNKLEVSFLSLNVKFFGK